MLNTPLLSRRGFLGGTAASFLGIIKPRPYKGGSVPVLANGAGISVAVPVGSYPVQVPISPQGITIINTGPVPVQLAATNPVQGAPITLAPNGALPWPGTGTLYAAVSGSTAGQLYVIAGVSSYNPGSSAVGSPASSNISPWAAPILAGQTTAIIEYFSDDLTASYQIISWGWWLEQPGSSPGYDTAPTSGGASLYGQYAGSTNDAFAILDNITPQEGGSNRAQGIIVQGTVKQPIPCTIINNFNVDLFFFLTAVKLS